MLLGGKSEIISKSTSQRIGRDVVHTLKLSIFINLYELVGSHTKMNFSHDLLGYYCSDLCYSLLMNLNKKKILHFCG